jgi:porin
MPNCGRQPPPASANVNLFPHARRQRQLAGRSCCNLVVASLIGILCQNVALAQTVNVATAPGEAAPGEAAPGETGAGLMPQAGLLGDAGGLRPSLEARGVSLGLQDSVELFGNATGGLHRGTAYDGVLQMSLGVDFAKAVDWTGATFNISALQISGRNLSADNLATLQTASGLEAARTTRLWEIWVQQALFGGKLSVRVGQQSLDQEFIVSAGASLFVNTAMGWPLLPSADLYAGGPAYPLASLGIRLNYQPTGEVSIIVGVFDDNANGGALFSDNSQLRGAAQSGTAFHLGTGALAIAELQYAATLLATALRGVYKIGGWFDTGSFADQRLSANGLSLADPAGDHVPLARRTNWSAYMVMDQAVWQPDPAGPRQVALFARFMGAPGDRNEISFSMNAGVALKQPWAARDNDTLGLGFGLVKISSRAAQLDADLNRFSRSALPVRSAEAFAELTYQAQLSAWLMVQPDLQYVVRPGGGIAAPARAGSRVGDEAVFGLRATIIF